MKTITILCVIQTGILLILLGKTAFVVDEPASPVVAGQDAPVSSPLARASADSGSTSLDYADEDQLRRIVREELAAQLSGLSEPGTQKDSAAVTKPRDEVEDREHRDRVAQQLDYYVSMGNISDAEMAQLQMDIAKLDAAGRTEMLGELSRAFNSGELSGRL